MTTAAGIATRQTPHQASAVADMRELARLVTLGACAGGLGGFLVGGVGGRLAMLLLRFTTEPSIKGVESDDGFVMGRFTAVDTFSLLMLCTILGSIGGLIVVFGRPFFPRAFAYIGWPIAAGAIVGATIIKSDGVDFTLLDPKPLAIAMFVAIPAAGALLITWLIETWEPWWWKRWRWTLVCAVAGLPSLAFFPLGVVAVLVAAGWFLAMRVERLRGLPQVLPVRGLAVGVFGVLTVMGLFALTEDISEIL